MRKRLFNPETEKINVEGAEFAQEVFLALKPIFDKYNNAGYSMRDAALIAYHEVSMNELIKVIK